MLDFPKTKNFCKYKHTAQLTPCDERELSSTAFNYMYQNFRYNELTAMAGKIFKQRDHEQEPVLYKYADLKGKISGRSRNLQFT